MLYAIDKILCEEVEELLFREDISENISELCHGIGPFRMTVNEMGRVHGFWKKWISLLLR